jgi:capsular exopolysaccharide synthesis family protein
MRSYVPGLPAPHIEPEEASGIEVTHVLRIFWRRRWVLASVFVLLFAFGYGIIKALPQRYTGEAVLILEVARGKAVDVESAAAQLDHDRAVINSEMDVLRSRALAEQVVDWFGLTENPEFDPTRRLSWSNALSLPSLLALLPQPVQHWLKNASEPANRALPGQLRTMVVNRVLSSLSVENDGQSNTVYLHVEAEEPTTAAVLANAFADFYLESDLRYREGTTEHAATWIKGKLDELRQQVTAADRAVQTFREQHQIIEVDHGPLIDQQLAELSRELSAASATRMLRQSESEALLRAGSGAGVFGVPRIAASPLVQELRSQQNELLAEHAEAGSQLGPRHNRMIEIESRLREVQDRLNQEVARVRAQIETDLQVARAQELALNGQLQAFMKQREAADRASITLRQLTSEAASARSLFDAFVQGLSRNAAEVGVSDANARILSRAVPPLFPSFPPRNLLLLLTIVLALLLAVIAVAVVEFLDRGYRDPADLERTHGMPVLGQIPLTGFQGVGDQHPSFTLIKHPASQFADAVQTVCTALTSAQEKQVVLVTSAVPGEGKTALAIALGRLAACSSKRVLLIDCDLRHPRVGRSLGQTSEYGIAELWEGRATVDQAFHFDKASSLMFLPAIGSVPFPGVILGSDFLHRLVQGARQQFDLVLLDSPPVGIVSDAMALSVLADVTIVAIRWGRTPRSAVATALKKLAAVGRPAYAAVFSHVDLKRCGKYYSTIKSEHYFADLEGRQAETG